MNKVLVTGGAGYLGPIVAKALERAGHVPVILDSLVTGRAEFVGDRAFYRGDIADRDLLARIVREHPEITSTVHMAALVSVPESVEKPATYYRENVAKSLVLFETLAELGRPDVVFSSSASVYGFDPAFEVREDSAVAPLSPYARTKLMMEQILCDLAAAGRVRAVILRYFNPIGADPDLETGAHAVEPSHVLGRLISAATGDGTFTITGTDYPTRDGTGLRDYIHTWDLARAHAAAVGRFEEAVRAGDQGSAVFNLGTGDGVTVRELVAAFTAAFGAPVRTTEGPRRPGDAAGAFANVDRAREVLGWEAELTLEDGIRSALAWMQHRPTVLGY